MKKLSKEYDDQLLKIEKELESIDVNHNKEFELAHEFVLLTRQLLKDNDFKDLIKIDNYKKVVISFYKIENTDIIKILSSIDNLINRKQREILREYYMQEANNWNTVDNNQKFLAKIKNSHILEYMSNDSINDSFKSFKQIIDKLKNEDPLGAISLIDEYKKFLKEVREKNKKVDKSLINSMLQSLQKKYKEIEPLTTSHMKEYRTSEVEISDAEIEKIKQEVKNRPFKRVIKIIPAYEVEIFNWMLENKEFRFTDLATIVNISSEGSETEDMYDEFSCIDKLLCKIMNKVIKEDKNVNFENQYRTVDNFYRDYLQQLRIKLGILVKLVSTRYLYDLVKSDLEKSNLPFSLVNFDENKIKIGHITQLFPILEIEIRKLGEKDNILPTKENLRYKIKFKDPSEILKKIIQKKSNIEENHYGFRDCRLELFLYYALYAANGLNIRNQCIHAREYFKGEELEFGLGVSLFCLHLLLRSEGNSK